MQISMTNTNTSFGKVTAYAAQKALNTTKNEEKTKELIAQGFNATNYDVGYSEKEDKYFVYRNLESPKGTSVLSFKVVMDDFEHAVNYSLLLQNSHNDYVTRVAKELEKEHLIALYTSDQTENL